MIYFCDVMGVWLFWNIVCMFAVVGDGKTGKAYPNWWYIYIYDVYDIYIYDVYDIYIVDM